MNRKWSIGFTLAELLIALAILGVIATFTIPKILSAQQNQKFNSIGKETAGTISEALQKAKLRGEINSSSSFDALTPYLNYVRIEPSSVTIDDVQTGPDQACSSSGDVCLRLHNGAIIHYDPGNTFGGTASTNEIYIDLDPDGQVTDGTTNGPGKSITFFIYYDGKIRTSATRLSGANPSLDPPWFSW